MMSDDEADPTATAASGADEVLDLFTSTLRSLANDAAAIRQMTDLADVLEDDEQRKKGANMNFHIHNDNNNNDDASLKAQLLEVERTVTYIEEKVDALREMINEENQALSQFETTLQQEADDQADDMEEMEQLLLQLGTTNKLQDDDNNTTTGTVSGNRATGRVLQPRIGTPHHRARSSGLGIDDDGTPSTSAASSNRLPIKGPSTISKRPASLSPKATKGHGRGFHTPGIEGNGPDSAMLFERITSSELEEHTRSAPFGLGRISRLDLNEALEEIEEMVQKKSVLETSQYHKHLQKVHPHEQQHSYLTSNSLQRRFDYLHQRQRASLGSSTNSSHGAHGTSTTAPTTATATSDNEISVSEQELRENCAFFRHGESTARATLSVLCSLKRLKQVPGSHKDIKYVCLFWSATNMTGEEELRG